MKMPENKLELILSPLERNSRGKVRCGVDVLGILNKTGPCFFFCHEEKSFWKNLMAKAAEPYTPLPRCVDQYPECKSYGKQACVSTPGKCNALSDMFSPKVS